MTSSSKKFFAVVVITNGTFLFNHYLLHLPPAEATVTALVATVTFVIGSALTMGGVFK